MDKILELQVQKLQDETKYLFNKEYEDKKLSSTTAWILWLFGLHYAYFGQRGKQLLFWITIGGLWIWWIIEAFRLNGKIAKYNDNLASELLLKYRIYEKG